MTNKIEFTCNARNLAQAIEFVSPAMSKEKTRFYLNGIYFDKKPGKELYLVAADGHRLHKIKMASNLDEETEFHFILDALSLQLIKTMLKSQLKYSNATITFNTQSRIINIDGRDFTAIDGEFPDYEKIIPKELIQTEIKYFNVSYLMDMLSSFLKIAKDTKVTFFRNKDSYHEYEPTIFKSNDSVDAIVIIMPAKNI